MEEGRGESDSLWREGSPLSFAELLRRHREAAELSQEALAARSGLSEDAVWLLERGRRRRPRPDTVRRLADALGLGLPYRAQLQACAEAARLAPEDPPLTDASGGLPRPRTRLVGRSRELSSARRLIGHTAVRLVTLTGVPGVGKTHLCIEVASRLRGRFPDGLHFVNLAPLPQPGLTGAALSRALRVRENGRGGFVDRLARHIGSRRLLIVLDNFEHVLPDALLLAQLLDRCPELRLLVTSRCRLGLHGERELLVQPLQLPDVSAEGSVEALSRAPAVQLFVRCARAVAPEFRVGAFDVAAVTEIVRRLDGLPLAFELAAPWLRLLTLQQLAARLGKPLALLVGGPPDLPERQRTMRRTLEWSYQLLEPVEQVLFRRLAVFACTAPLDGVEIVCAPDGGQDGVLTALSGLVDKNLVLRTGQDEECRVAMLETIRDYAHALLRASGEADRLSHAHLHYYAALAEEAEDGLTGRDQARWFARLDREHDNLRTALRWASVHGEAECGLRLGTQIWRYLETHGHSQEGLEWLDTLVAAAPAASPPLRGEALRAAGNLARRMADYDGARHRYAAALALARVERDERGVSSGLNAMANLAYLRGDVLQAISLHEEALASRRRLGDVRGIAVTLNNLAIAVYQAGDRQRAMELAEEALHVRRQLGDGQGMAYQLVNLGMMARLQGEHHKALEWLRECEDLCRRLEDLQLLAGALTSQGDLSRDHGDPADAATLYRAALAALIRLGEIRTAAAALEGLAATAWLEGAPDRSARLYGVADGLRRTTKQPQLPAQRADHEPVVCAVRAALGDPVFAEMHSAGGASRFQEVIAGLSQGS